MGEKQPESDRNKFSNQGKTPPLTNSNHSSALPQSSTPLTPPPSSTTNQLSNMDAITKNVDGIEVKIYPSINSSALLRQNFFEPPSISSTLVHNSDPSQHHLHEGLHDDAQVRHDDNDDGCHSDTDVLNVPNDYGHNDGLQGDRLYMRNAGHRQIRSVPSNDSSGGFNNDFYNKRDRFYSTQSIGGQLGSSVDDGGRSSWNLSEPLSRQNNEEPKMIKSLRRKSDQMTRQEWSSANELRMIGDATHEEQFFRNLSRQLNSSIDVTRHDRLLSRKYYWLQDYNSSNAFQPLMIKSNPCYPGKEPSNSNNKSVYPVNLLSTNNQPIDQNQSIQRFGNWSTNQSVNELRIEPVNLSINQSYNQQPQHDDQPQPVLNLGSADLDSTKVSNDSPPNYEIDRSRLERRSLRKSKCPSFSIVPEERDAADNK